jgi:putative DNA primase/helicase
MLMIGEELNSIDFEKLSREWITPELARSAGLRRVSSIEGAQLVGKNGKGDFAGITIPYFWPGESAPREYILRLDRPELEPKSDGTIGEKIKYAFPPGRGNMLYIPPGVTPEMLADLNLPLILCEGAKKALALWRLATEEIESPRFLPVAISGCWNWRGTIGREAGPDGSRRAVKGPIGDLNRIPWQSRLVFVCFDSDKRRNPSTQAAERELSKELRSRGALVRIIELPDLAGLDKTGADDFLAHAEGGLERMLELIATAKEFEPDLIRYLANDHGNAGRIIACYGDQLRFCHAFRKWLVWNGTRWAIDATGHAVRLAKFTMLEHLRQAIAASNRDAERFARTSLNSKNLKAALELAQCEIFVTPDGLDADAFFLNCLNGTVDLRTGKLMPHDPANLITKIVHFNYNETAKCPKWESFLQKIMGSEKDNARSVRMVDWLKKAAGYSITASTREKAVFACYGPGDNGKTTFLETIRSITNEYAVLIQIDSLMLRREETNNTQADLADLRGARFAMTSETESGQRLAEGKLKRISQGMGQIKAVRKYENPITFSESHKLWLDCNHKPVVRGSDNAIWSRLYLIPFEVTIPDDEKDKELGVKLLEEGEGILAWLIAGAKSWYSEGLGRPSEVKQAGKTWRDESDPLKDFIEDRCVLDAKATCTVAQLWAAYEQWAKENGEKDPLSRKEFNERLKERGCVQDRTTATRGWKGIGVAYDNDKK